MFHLFSKCSTRNVEKGVKKCDWQMLITTVSHVGLEGNVYIWKGRRMSELKQDFNKTLLPCPFCPKGQARLQRRGHGYYVICKSCGCRTPLFHYQFDSREKLREQAIEAWNQRKPMDDIVERLEEKANEPRYQHDEEYFYIGIVTAIEIVKGEV